MNARATLRQGGEYKLVAEYTLQATLLAHACLELTHSDALALVDLLCELTRHPKPIIRFSRKWGSVAWKSRNEIHFSYRVSAETVLHEFAHLIADREEYGILWEVRRINPLGQSGYWVFRTEESAKRFQERNRVNLSPDSWWEMGERQSMRRSHHGPKFVATLDRLAELTEGLI